MNQSAYIITTLHDNGVICCGIQTDWEREETESVGAEDVVQRSVGNVFRPRQLLYSVAVESD